MFKLWGASRNVVQRPQERLVWVSPSGWDNLHPSWGRQLKQ